MSGVSVAPFLLLSICFNIYVVAATAVVVAAIAPTNGRRKKTDFWCFRRFFSLIRAAKTPQIGHFVRFCGSANFCRLRHLLRHLLCQNFAQMLPQKRRTLRCRKNAAKSNEVPQKRRFCGVYKWQKVKNGQKSVYYVVGSL